MMKTRWKAKYSKLRPSQLAYSDNKVALSHHYESHLWQSYVSWNISTDMWRVVAFCTAAALLLYINTIYADFAYDDSRAILKNQDLHPETPISNIWFDDFWGTPLRHSGSHKSYRPLVVLSFRLNYAVHQLSPGGYHLFNTILHAITTALYTITIALVIRREFITIIAGVLFAIHPIHTEAVAGIVGRADILCAIFYLLSILTFMKYCELRTVQCNKRFLWMALTFTSVTASTLSKEIGITVLGVCAVYYIFYHSGLTIMDILQLKTKKIKPHLETMSILTIVGVTLLGLRLYFMGYSPPSFSPADNPAADSDSLLTRTLTFLYLPVFNFLLLVFPVTLSFDWSMSAIPLVESLFDSRTFVTILFYGLVLWVTKYSLSFFYKSSATSEDSCPPSPKHYQSNDSATSNGHVAKLSNGNGQSLVRNGVDTLIHRRYRRDSSSSAESSSCDENQNEVKILRISNLHRHHATLLLGLSLTILPFLPASNLFFYVGFVVAERVLYVSSMGFCLLVAEVSYQLYKKVKYDVNRKIILYGCLIVISTVLSIRTYSRCLDWRSEEQLYTSGISINPAKAWGNLANVLNNRGDIKGAEQAYRSALSHRGNMADVHYNLGILLQGQNRHKEALDEYNMAIKCRPRLTVAYLNKGIVLALMGNHHDAEKAYKECTVVDTTGLKDPRMHETAKISALYNLGRLYAEQKNYQLAISTYKLALDRRPEYYSPPSIYNLLGEAYFNIGRYEDAENAYRQSLLSKPDHLPAHLTMARLMNAKKQHVKAEEWYKKALEIDDKDAQTYHHYALFLGDQGRQGDALALWQKSAFLSPNDFDTIFNLASSLRQAGKSNEATEQYEKAVQLSPQSATAHMNLGAMYHINRNYSMAEKSYIKALTLNPSDQITKNNLKKLQNIMSRGKR